MSKSYFQHCLPGQLQNRDGVTRYSRRIDIAIPDKSWHEKHPYKQETAR